MELPRYLVEKGVQVDWSEVMQVLEEILADFPIFETRKRLLFLEFLPVGYTHVTLNCIDPELFFELLINKVRVGMLITLYDDLADHPEGKNPKLLSELYKLPYFNRYLERDGLDAEELKILDCAERMWKDVLRVASTFPYYEKFEKFFAFDIKQFYIANLYSEMISDYPQMANQTENRIYLPHNMGMIITGMMDLMATPTGVFAELGAIRHLLYNGQILGRLSNVLITLERELGEGDVTNEICSTALQHMQIRVTDLRDKSIDELKIIFQPTIEKLYNERDELYAKMNSVTLETFSVPYFVESLKHLHYLHTKMKGDI